MEEEKCISLEEGDSPGKKKAVEKEEEDFLREREGGIRT